jgi:hypothetical protein
MSDIEYALKIKWLCFLKKKMPITDAHIEEFQQDIKSLSN